MRIHPPYRKAAVTALLVLFGALALTVRDSRALVNNNFLNNITINTSAMSNIRLLPSTILPFLKQGMNLQFSKACTAKLNQCKKDANQAYLCDSKKKKCLSQNNSGLNCSAQYNTCQKSLQKQLEKCKNNLYGNKACWLLAGGSTTKTCTGSTSQSCTDMTGASGTQSATTCNTQTGQWNWGSCVANPPPPPPPPPACTPESPQTQTISCPAGQTGAITQQRTSSCPGPTWSVWSTVSNSCVTQTCQGNAPTCPSGYTGSYACQNGSWVNQCVAPGACTSFDYSAWSTCSNSTQTRTVTASYPSGCTGGTPVLSQSCVMQCQGTAPACGLGYVGSYVCQNGSWVNQCQVACSQPPPPCSSGWTGSQSCMMTAGGGYVWMNTCVPPGTPSCYKGVSYILYTAPTGAQTAYAKCVGSGNVVNGQMCLLNNCSVYQPYNSYGSDSGFKSYTDTILGYGYKSYISPTSCSQSAHVYTQCP